MKKRNVIFGVVGIALGALLLIGALTFAAPCPHDGTLKTLVAVFGGLLALVSLINAIKENPVFEILQLIISVLIALTPGVLVKLCASPQMRCQTLTRPFALVIAIVSAVLFVWQLILSIRVRRAR